MEAVPEQLQTSSMSPENISLPELSQELLIGTEGLARAVTEAASDPISSTPTVPISKLVYVERVTETFGSDSIYNQSNTLGGGGGSFDMMNRGRRFKLGSNRRLREASRSLLEFGSFGFGQIAVGAASSAEDDEEDE